MHAKQWHPHRLVCDCICAAQRPQWHWLRWRCHSRPPIRLSACWCAFAVCAGWQPAGVHAPVCGRAKPSLLHDMASPRYLGHSLAEVRLPSAGPRDYYLRSSSAIGSPGGGHASQAVDLAEVAAGAQQPASGHVCTHRSARTSAALCLVGHTIKERHRFLQLEACPLQAGMPCGLHIGHPGAPAGARMRHLPTL